MHKVWRGDGTSAVAVHGWVDLFSRTSFEWPDGESEKCLDCD
jgi:hypothetical protein